MTDRMRFARPAYRRSSLSIDTRVADLLSRMTLDEKIAQLQAIMREQLMVTDQTGNESFDPQKAQACYPNGVGRISAMSHGITLEKHFELYNAMQRHFVENTRLGIPVLVDCEGLHGCMSPGCTSYPQAIGLAASFEPALVEEIATAIGREARARANHQLLSPVLDIARDVRAGRTEETYGEDTFLATRMGLAYVRGAQSQRVAATPKHFVANFVGDGGRDSFPIHMNARMLREVYLPPFEACVREGGALGIMSAYHSLDGRPCSANKWLLVDLLKKEWGFKGAVVSDWGAVNFLHDFHTITTDYAGCAEESINNGLDLEQCFNLCWRHLPRLVRQKRVSVATVNEAVRRILYVKFWTGIFDHPYFSPTRAIELTNCAPHRALALEAARKSMTLLKNDGFLPLTKALRRVAVIGPNAAQGRLGGYTDAGATALSPLDGIRNLLGPTVEVVHTEGCPLKEPRTDGIPAAAELARSADAVVLCVGNHAVPFNADATEGESQDRCNLDLPGSQQQLILEVIAANPNTAVVLVGGSAVTMLAWVDRVRAILLAWYAGQEGGTAIAEALFGDLNPAGRLPITFPKTTGQCPLYYNTKPTGRTYDYNDLRGRQEQFAFGHGLSYTSFEYTALKVTRQGRGKSVRHTIRATIRNTGSRAGDEVVQLYLRDEVSRLTRPLKELKGFTRLSLKPGQARRVQFVLTWKELAYLGQDLKPTLEPGNLIFMLGASSADIRLTHHTVPAKDSPATAFLVSALRPPLDDIRTASLPPADLAFTSVEPFGAGAFTCTNLTQLPGNAHGMRYIRATLHTRGAGKGCLFLGADAPFKLWVNGRELLSDPYAINPLAPNEYSIPVRWKRGPNTLVVAISTNHGKTWGIAARGTLGAQAR